MEITFTSRDTPEKWFSEFASQFKIPLKGDTLRFPPALGKGFMKQFRFFDGMALTCFQMHLREPLEFVRKPSSGGELLPIFFYSQESPFNQYVGEGKKDIGFHTDKGVFLCSSQIGSRWSVPAHTEDFQVTLTVKKSWLLDNLDNKKSSIFEAIRDNQPYYLFESLTSDMLHTIHSIRTTMARKPALQTLLLHQKSLELLIQLLGKLDARPSDRPGYRIIQADVQKAFALRKEILEALPGCLPVSALADAHGMSLRKLQSVFKQIFGMSVSQFVLSEKMRLAKKLLEAGTYTVSEVGYQLGYSNLSHFSQAFKNRYGETPKKFSQRINAHWG